MLTLTTLMHDNSFHPVGSSYEENFGSTGFRYKVIPWDLIRGGCSGTGEGPSTEMRGPLPRPEIIEGDLEWMNGYDYPDWYLQKLRGGGV